MVSPPAGFGTNDEAPLEPAVVQSVLDLSSIVHLSTVLAVIRLDQRDRNRVKNKDVAEELNDMFDQFTYPGNTHRSVEQLEQAGWVTIDRSERYQRGNNIQLSDWGEYVTTRLGMDELARRFDPDADIPADAPQPPAYVDVDGER